MSKPGPKAAAPNLLEAAKLLCDHKALLFGYAQAPFFP